MNEEILNHNAKTAIETAYDKFEKEEFLKRLYNYINSTIDLTIRREHVRESIIHIANNMTHV